VEKSNLKDPPPRLAGAANGNLRSVGANSFARVADLEHRPSTPMARSESFFSSGH